MKAKYPYTEYLEKQVLLVSLKAADNGEYIGIHFLLNLCLNYNI